MRAFDNVKATTQDRIPGDSTHSEFIGHPIEQYTERSTGKGEADSEDEEEEKQKAGRDGDDRKAEEANRETETEATQKRMKTHVRTSYFEFRALLFKPRRAAFDSHASKTKRDNATLYERREVIMDACDKLLPARFDMVKGAVNPEDMPLNTPCNGVLTLFAV